MVFLPEASDYVCDDLIESVKLAECLDGPLLSKYRIVAQENSIWISVGVHLKVNNIANVKNISVVMVER